MKYPQLGAFLLAMALLSGGTYAVENDAPVVDLAGGRVAETERIVGVARPLIVAHRGASREAPENTLPAFHLAWKQGADAIEEVFATIPTNKKIYIEIKCGSEIIPALLKAIKKSGLKNDQIVVISFHQNVIHGLKTKAPHFKAYWLSGFKKDRAGRLTPSFEIVITTLKRIKADGLSSSRNLIDERFVRQVMEQGFEHHVWTVDDARTATRFKQWGAKSIATNVPGSMRGSLSKTKATEKLPWVKP